MAARQRQAKPTNGRCHAGWLTIEGRILANDHGQLLRIKSTGSEIRSMSFSSFQFGDVWAHFGDLLWGAWLTIRLSALAMFFGLVVGVCFALGKTSGPAFIRRAIDGYIEIIRNTPFLVQIYLVFFGLPSLGLRLSPDSAALTAMVVNVGAYSTEIVRAGIESVSKGQVEAGLSLGLRRLQVFFLVVLLPALRAIYPALTSQFMLLMLSSSVLSVISAQELTAVATDMQSRTFRTIETYLVVTAMYLVMSLGFSAAFAIIEKLAFRYPAIGSGAPQQ